MEKLPMHHDIPEPAVAVLGMFDHIYAYGKKPEGNKFTGAVKVYMTDDSKNSINVMLEAIMEMADDLPGMMM